MTSNPAGCSLKHMHSPRAVPCPEDDMAVVTDSSMHASLCLAEVKKRPSHASNPQLCHILLPDPPSIFVITIFYVRSNTTNQLKGESAQMSAQNSASKQNRDVRSSPPDNFCPRARSLAPTRLPTVDHVHPMNGVNARIPNLAPHIRAQHPHLISGPAQYTRQKP